MPAARSADTTVLDLETPHGPARAHISRVDGAVGSVVLGHGAGGGVGAPDLVAAATAAIASRFLAVLVEQPYRVAGRRASAPASHLDGAWMTVVEQLREEVLAQGPLIVGGRSAGARVACRTAARVQADGVLCLAFPVHPPGRADDPLKSRLPELDAVDLPVLVIQGERDPFGRPPDGPSRRVTLVPGTHSLKASAKIGEAVAAWLGERL